MEKMDMAWCSIHSNLILPLYLSSSLSSSPSVCPPPLQGCTQASPAGGEGNRQQGSSCQTFASHCMSAFCTSRQRHNECHMSNDASLPLTYGNSVIYGKDFIVLLWYRAGCVICESCCPEFVSNCWCDFFYFLLLWFHKDVYSCTQGHTTGMKMIEITWLTRISQSVFVWEFESGKCIYVVG